MTACPEPWRGAWASLRQLTAFPRNRRENYDTSRDRLAAGDVLSMASVKRTGVPCAILFADVCGSAELYEVLGNAQTQAAIARLLNILCQAATRHAGDIIKTIGAEVMSVFP